MAETSALENLETLQNAGEYIELKKYVKAMNDLIFKTGSYSEIRRQLGRDLDITNERGQIEVKNINNTIKQYPAVFGFERGVSKSTLMRYAQYAQKIATLSGSSSRIANDEQVEEAYKIYKRKMVEKTTQSQEKLEAARKAYKGDKDDPNKIGSKKELRQKNRAVLGSALMIPVAAAVPVALVGGFGLAAWNVVSAAITSTIGLASGGAVVAIVGAAAFGPWAISKIAGIFSNRIKKLKEAWAERKVAKKQAKLDKQAIKSYEKTLRANERAMALDNYIEGSILREAVTEASSEFSEILETAPESRVEAERVATAPESRVEAERVATAPEVTAEERRVTGPEVTAEAGRVGGPVATATGPEVVVTTHDPLARGPREEGAEIEEEAEAPEEERALELFNHGDWVDLVEARDSYDLTDENWSEFLNNVPPHLIKANTDKQPDWVPYSEAILEKIDTPSKLKGVNLDVYRTKGLEDNLPNHYVNESGVGYVSRIDDDSWNKVKERVERIAKSASGVRRDLEEKLKGSKKQWFDIERYQLENGISDKALDSALAGLDRELSSQGLLYKNNKKEPTWAKYADGLTEAVEDALKKETGTIVLEDYLENFRGDDNSLLGVEGYIPEDLGSKLPDRVARSTGDFSTKFLVNDEDWKLLKDKVILKISEKSAEAETLTAEAKVTETPVVEEEVKKEEKEIKDKSLTEEDLSLEEETVVLENADGGGEGDLEEEVPVTPVVTPGAPPVDLSDTKKVNKVLEVVNEQIKTKTGTISLKGAKKQQQITQLMELFDEISRGVDVYYQALKGSRISKKFINEVLKSKKADVVKELIDQTNATVSVDEVLNAIEKGLNPEPQTVQIKIKSADGALEKNIIISKQLADKINKKIEELGENSEEGELSEKVRIELSKDKAIVDELTRAIENSSAAGKKTVTVDGVLASMANGGVIPPALENRDPNSKEMIAATDAKEKLNTAKPGQTLTTGTHTIGDEVKPIGTIDSIVGSGLEVPPVSFIPVVRPSVKTLDQAKTDYQKGLIKRALENIDEKYVNVDQFLSGSWLVDLKKSNINKTQKALLMERAYKTLEGRVVTKEDVDRFNAGNFITYAQRSIRAKMARTSGSSRETLQSGFASFMQPNGVKAQYEAIIADLNAGKPVEMSLFDFQKLASEYAYYKEYEAFMEKHKDLENKQAKAPGKVEVKAENTDILEVTGLSKSGNWSKEAREKGFEDGVQALVNNGLSEKDAREQLKTALQTKYKTAYNFLGEEKTVEKTAVKAENTDILEVTGLSKSGNWSKEAREKGFADGVQALVNNGMSEKDAREQLKTALQTKYKTAYNFLDAEQTVKSGSAGAGDGAHHAEESKEAPVVEEETALASDVNDIALQNAMIEKENEELEEIAKEQEALKAEQAAKEKELEEAKAEKKEILKQEEIKKLEKEELQRTREQFEKLFEIESRMADWESETNRARQDGENLKDHRDYKFALKTASNEARLSAYNIPDAKQINDNKTELNAVKEALKGKEQYRAQIERIIELEAKEKALRSEVNKIKRNHSKLEKTRSQKEAELEQKKAAVKALEDAEKNNKKGKDATKVDVEKTEKQEPVVVSHEEAMNKALKDDLVKDLKDGKPVVVIRDGKEVSLTTEEQIEQAIKNKDKFKVDQLEIEGEGVELDLGAEPEWKALDKEGRKQYAIDNFKDLDTAEAFAKMDKMGLTIADAEEIWPKMHPELEEKSEEDQAKETEKEENKAVLTAVFVNGKPVSVSKEQIENGSWKEIVDNLAKTNPEEAEELKKGCKEIADAHGITLEDEAPKIENAPEEVEANDQEPEEINKKKLSRKEIKARKKHIAQELAKGQKARDKAKAKAEAERVAQEKAERKAQEKAEREAQEKAEKEREAKEREEAEARMKEIDAETKAEADLIIAEEDAKRNLEAQEPEETKVYDSSKTPIDAKTEIEAQIKAGNYVDIDKFLADYGMDEEQNKVAREWLEMEGLIKANDELKAKEDAEASENEAEEDVQETKVYDSSKTPIDAKTEIEAQIKAGNYVDIDKFLADYGMDEGQNKVAREWLEMEGLIKANDELKAKEKAETSEVENTSNEVEAEAQEPEETKKKKLSRKERKAQEREEAERKAKEEAERKAKEEAERVAQEKAAEDAYNKERKEECNNVLEGYISRNPKDAEFINANKDEILENMASNNIFFDFSSMPDSSNTPNPVMLEIVDKEIMAILKQTYYSIQDRESDDEAKEDAETSEVENDSNEVEAEAQEPEETKKKKLSRKERKAQEREEAERKAKEEAERKAQEEAELEAQEKAKEEAELERKTIKADKILNDYISRHPEEAQFINDNRSKFIEEMVGSESMVDIDFINSRQAVDSTMYTWKNGVKTSLIMEGMKKSNEIAKERIDAEVALSKELDKAEQADAETSEVKNASNEVEAEAQEPEETKKNKLSRKERKAQEREEAERKAKEEAERVAQEKAEREAQEKAELTRKIKKADEILKDYVSRHPEAADFINGNRSKFIERMIAKNDVDFIFSQQSADLKMVDWEIGVKSDLRNEKIAERIAQSREEAERKAKEEAERKVQEKAETEKVATEESSEVVEVAEEEHKTQETKENKGKGIFGKIFGRKPKEKQTQADDKLKGKNEPVEKGVTPEELADAEAKFNDVNEKITKEQDQADKLLQDDKLKSKLAEYEELSEVVDAINDNNKNVQAGLDILDAFDAKHSSKKEDSAPSRTQVSKEEIAKANGSDSQGTSIDERRKALELEAKERERIAREAQEKRDALENKGKSGSGLSVLEAIEAEDKAKQKAVIKEDVVDNHVNMGVETNNDVEHKVDVKGPTRVRISTEELNAAKQEADKTFADISSHNEEVKAVIDKNNPNASKRSSLQEALKAREEARISAVSQADLDAAKAELDGRISDQASLDDQFAKVTGNEKPTSDFDARLAEEKAKNNSSEENILEGVDEEYIEAGRMANLTDEQIAQAWKKLQAAKNKDDSPEDEMGDE